MKTALNTRVVIAGGGLIGTSIAYHLAKKGMKAIVIEKGGPGCQASGANAGEVWAQSGLPGPGPFGELCMLSSRLYDGLSRELPVDIQYSRFGVIHVAQSGEEMDRLDATFKWQKKKGLQVEKLTRKQAFKMEPCLSSTVVGALFFRYDVRLNPMLLTAGYYLGALKGGARFFANTSVRAVSVGNGRVKDVRTGKRSFKCDVFVNAAGSWAAELGKMAGLEIPVFPVKGQMLVTERMPLPFVHSFVSSSCYILPQPAGNVLIGSTTERSGFDKSVTHEVISALGRAAAGVVPALSRFNLIRTWAGLRPCTPDEEPILGFAPGISNFLMACGHFRKGCLLSAVTGKLISELIVEGRSSVPLEPFSLSRFSRGRSKRMAS